MFDRSDALASLDSLAESFVDMAGASSCPLDDLELIDLPSDTECGGNLDLGGGGESDGDDEGVHDDDENGVRDVPGGGNGSGPRTNSTSSSLVSSHAPSSPPTGAGAALGPSSATGAGSGSASSSQARSLLFPPGIPLPHVNNTNPTSPATTETKPDKPPGLDQRQSQTQPPSHSLSTSTASTTLCPHIHTHLRPHPSSASSVSTTTGAAPAQNQNQAMTLISPLPTPRPTWLPSPAAPLPQAHLVTLAGYGLRQVPYHKKHVAGLAVDEKNIAAAALTLASERPESAARAVGANPGRYGAQEDLDSAMALAHAHCLLHDLFAADTRLDGDAVYATLVSRFIADVISSPAVVALITAVDTNAKNVLGLRDLPPLISQMGATPLCPGLALGLRSALIEVEAGSTTTKERLQGLTLIPHMKARELVWSTSQDTLTESWFPWLVVEANGLCGSAAHAHIRLLSGMRFALAMYARLHVAACTMSPLNCQKRSDESRTVYGLLTVGAMWQFLAMQDDNGQYPVSVIWTGHVHDPKAMAHGLSLLRLIGAQADHRLRLVCNWLACVCGDTDKKREVGSPKPQTAARSTTSLLPKSSLSPPEPSKHTMHSSTRSSSPEKAPLKPWASAFQPQPLKPKDDKPLESTAKSFNDLLPIKLMTERSPNVLYSNPGPSTRNSTSQPATQHLNTYNFGMPNLNYNNHQRQPGGFIFPNQPPGPPGLGNWGHDNWQQPNPMFVPRHNTNPFPLNLGPTWPPSNSGIIGGDIRSPLLNNNVPLLNANGPLPNGVLSGPSHSRGSSNLGQFWQPPPAIGVKLAPPVKRPTAMLTTLTSPSLERHNK